MIIRGFLFLPLFVSALLAGCSSAPEKVPVPPVPVAAEGKGWWYAAFRFDWPKQQPPAWHRDVMVAHRIIRPVLAAHRGQIDLWRVHRRAARDGAGHRFSFIFRASAAQAARIYADIRANPYLAAWRRAGWIREVHYDDVSRIKRPNIEDTSDPGWPPIIQQTWPAYIMGVSEMWLDLVCRLGDEYAGKDAKEEPYLKVSRILDRLWRDNAHHAFLHHLNAIYGYQPFLTRY